MKSFLLVVLVLVLLIQVSLCASCPYGWNSVSQDGKTLCKKEKLYGRGAGYPWKFGDGFNLNKAKSRCEQANPQGCEQYGAIIYPKCAEGYNNSGCCLCAFDHCPSGFKLRSVLMENFIFTVTCEQL